MAKLHIAILRGGPSSEYEVSLKTGGAVLNHLPIEKYQGHDIFIDKEGTWHRDGAPRQPQSALSGIDAVFNALHGEYGEDGEVQQTLDFIGIPYTGSDAFASRLGMNKALTKETFKKFGIRTPYYTVVKKTDDPTAVQSFVFHHYLLPFVVKPVSSGSSVGVTIVKNFNDLLSAIKKAFAYSENVLVEEFVKGREATVGVVNKLRGLATYVLPPVEIIPHQKSEFFDYDAKYGGGSQEICPGNFSESEKKELERMAALIHEKIGLRHYSRSDFIVSPRRGIYALEVNTLPGLTPESLLPKSLAAVGVEFSDFLDHVIQLALNDLNS